MIYISAPYSSEDKKLVEYRVKEVSIYCGKLLKEGKSNITPITLGTTILQHCDLPSDFGFWDKLSYELIELCDELHVLMLVGWDLSIGVTHEIHYAKKKGIKITYIKI